MNTDLKIQVLKIAKKTIEDVVEVDYNSILEELKCFEMVRDEIDNYIYFLVKCIEDEGRG